MSATEATYASFPASYLAIVEVVVFVVSY